MTSSLTGSNPVLTRELRASLRNARAFGLIALYVAILGAVVVAQFPGEMSLDLQSDGGQKGQALFRWFIGGQAILILLMLPALATGALAQERERQTLEPLLLSPMTPLQIVWGKAGGVLSLVCLLLISTLPLTSLCFLLGGVSPGELIGFYGALLGLAVYTTGLGLYCSARWPGATRAMIYCYLLLLPLTAVMAAFLPLGGLLAGFIVLYLTFVGIKNLWVAGKTTSWGKRLGKAYPLTILLVIPVFLWLLRIGFWSIDNFGALFTLLYFVLAYLVMIAQYGMLQTARELMMRNDPEAPLRQKLADFKDDWNKAVAPQPVYLPDPRITATKPPAEKTNTSSSFAPNLEIQPSASPAPVLSQTVEPPPPTPATIASQKAAAKETYGKVPFLSDKLNPIYAKELRSGLLGKFEYLFRLCYGATIASELALLGVMMMGMYEPKYFELDFEAYFLQWAQYHLVAVVIFGSWFGSRAIAPEREGQTLMQLFTIPLPAIEIIKGKLAAVLTFTLYIWVLAIPVSLIMGLIALVPFGVVLQFIIVEAVFALLAAAWGVYCSFQGGTVRRAMTWAISGSALFLFAQHLIRPLWDVLRALKVVDGYATAEAIIRFLPGALLMPVRTGTVKYTVAAVPQYEFDPGFTITVTLAYAVIAALLLAFTSRGFRKFAQTA